MYAMQCLPAAGAWLSPLLLYSAVFRKSEE